MGNFRIWRGVILVLLAMQAGELVAQSQPAVSLRAKAAAIVPAPGFIDPMLISNKAVAQSAHSYADDFISNETVSVSVKSAANVRDKPGTAGSVIVSTVAPGAQLEGKWVRGVDRVSRWLKTTNGGYVWDRNLSASNTQILGTWELVGKRCCGEYPDEDGIPWQRVTGAARVQVTFNRDGTFLSTGRENTRGRWSIRDDSVIDGWVFYSVYFKIEKDMMTVTHIPTRAIYTSYEKWRRVSIQSEK